MLHVVYAIQHLRVLKPTVALVKDKLLAEEESRKTALAYANIGSASALMTPSTSALLSSIKDPQQLALIDWAENSARGGSWSSRSANFTYTQWQEIQRVQGSFSGLLGWSAARFNLTNGGEPRFADGLYVSGNFFPVLVVPMLCS